jgi:hypothetical protein
VLIKVKKVKNYCQGWSEGLPPPHGDQQEDLQDRRGIQDEGRQARQEQRRHRVSVLSTVVYHT